jgi:ATP synthase protein I
MLDSIRTRSLSSGDPAVQGAPEGMTCERAVNEHAPDDRLSELQARIDRLKDEQSRRKVDGQAKPTSGYGMAFTITADMVGGLIGGAGLGWLVDRWLQSSPVGLIAFFFLGAAAGMWNAYRTVRGYDMSLGFSRPPAPPPGMRDDKETPAGARSEKRGGDHRGQSTPSVRDRTDHSDQDRRH